MKTKSKRIINNEFFSLKPHIIIKNNLRYVEPYEFKYQLYIKGRWVNKPLLQTLINEFSQYSSDYFKNAIENKKILINNKPTEANYILKRNDFLTHFTIRKENPIINSKLEIVYEDKNFLVVNKPSSWPVHVCGGYNFNTLLKILYDEYNYKNIKVLHRLDKFTSGVVLFAKNKESAERFRKKLGTDQVQKIYFARVKGNFLVENNNKNCEIVNNGVVVKRFIVFVSKSKGIYTDINDEDVEKFENNNNNMNILKDGVSNNIINEEENNNNDNNDNNNNDNNNNEINSPKFSETFFEKIFYDEDSNTSVVICKPKTGRTHQIRIHLRYLGFPIANDPCYGGIIYNDVKELDENKNFNFEVDNFNNDNKEEKNEKENKEKEKNNNNENNKNTEKKYNNLNEEIIDNQNNINNNNIIISNNNKENNEKNNKDNNNIIDEEKSIENKTNIKEEKKIYTNSSLFCYKIWLHAWTYKFENYEFKTSIPNWAEKSYKISHKF